MVTRGLLPGLFGVTGVLWRGIIGVPVGLVRWNVWVTSGIGRCVFGVSVSLVGDFERGIVGVTRWSERGKFGVRCGFGRGLK